METCGQIPPIERSHAAISNSSKTSDICSATRIGRMIRQFANMFERKIDGRNRYGMQAPF